MKLIVTTLILILALSVCQAAPGTYIASKYNAPTSSVMTDMNDSGLIVGVESTGYSRAFKIENGVKTLLQMPSQYIYSKAMAVGESGIIVGCVYTSASTYAYKPCYWDTDGNMHLLADWGYGGMAQSINSQNKIAGLITGGWATTWTDFTQRSTITAQYEFDKIMINDQGTIVVTSYSRDLAYYWSDADSRYVPLGRSGYDSSYAIKINNRGQILGEIDDLDLAEKYVVWDNHQQNPRILQKPNINGRIRLFDALDINDTGLVVGTAPAVLTIGELGVLDPVACMWDDLSVYQLDNLVTGVFDGQNELTGVSFTDAYLIDNNNRILCKGKYNNQYSYYMLTPVPEPSSIITLLCGLGGVAGTIWRRRR